VLMRCATQKQAQDHAPDRLFLLENFLTKG
jgi:hypothetical protein